MFDDIAIWNVSMSPSVKMPFEYWLCYSHRITVCKQRFSGKCMVAQLTTDLFLLNGITIPRLMGNWLYPLFWSDIFHCI
jgi:hypothetical protein